MHGFFPWKRQFIYPDSQCRELDMSMTPTLPPSVYLGVLGLTGVSAYLPIVKIAEPKAGDVGACAGPCAREGLHACNPAHDTTRCASAQCL